MSDEQIRRRLRIRNRLIFSVALIVVSACLLYFRFYTEAIVDLWKREKQQEESLNSQIQTLTDANNQLMSTIEENGKELVSFSSDKLKYVNLASELSLENDVRINKLTVSNVWTEGEMSGMTTTIEIEGLLTDVQDFVNEYCSTDYTNRINVISCRPSGRQVWLARDIDGEKVLTWFNLEEDEMLYEDLEDGSTSTPTTATTGSTSVSDEESDNPNLDSGLPVVDVTAQSGEGYAVYDPELGYYVDSVTGQKITQAELDAEPITLESMFADKPMKVYLVIDFLGRA